MPSSDFGRASDGASDAAPLDQIATAIRETLEAKHRAREAALGNARRAIQASARSIRALHRQEFDGAAALIDEARVAVEEAQATLAPYPDLYHAGFLHDAVKEYVEAALTLALVADRPLPSPQALHVEDVAYLHGLAEAAGELRRYALDSLRQGDLPRAERMLASMDEIYGQLVTVDYPDAITRGLRRTTDMVRAVTERTRGDLTVSEAQLRLEDQIRTLQRRMYGTSAE